MAHKLLNGALMFRDNCPLCGTKGKNWKGENDVFVCPNCSSIYSKFGMVIEAQKDVPEFWN